MIEGWRDLKGEIDKMEMGLHDSRKKELKKGKEEDKIGQGKKRARQEN